MAALRTVFAGACLLAALPAAALECTVESASPSWLADSAAFSLKCDAAVTGTVAWEFGDGEELAAAVGRTSVKHLYAAAGSYTVFARIEGTFPAIRQHAVLHAPTAGKPARSTTILFDAKRGRVWCVNADNNSVAALDASSLVRLEEIPVGRHPRTLALDGSGRIWVANQDDATLTVLDGGTYAVLHTVALPRASRPFGICFSPDGSIAYVTLEATGRLVRIDTSTRQVTAGLDLFPTPRGIAVSQDGKRILVTRFLSPADQGEVADVEAAPFRLTRIIPLKYDTHADNESNGGGVPNSLSSLTISPDGRRAWVPFKKDNVKRGLFATPGSEAPTSESTVRTGLAAIDLASGAEAYGERKDLDNRSMASAVAFDSKGSFAYAATLTSNHVAILDNATGVDATAIEPTDLVHELAPDGLAFGAGDSILFVHYFMSREVAAYAVSEVGGANVIPRRALIPTVKKEALSPEVLRGKQIFYNASDPRMARERYLSCAACHLDGHSDGRVWDFTHKGEGMRRTTSLLGRGGMAHGPVHWSANFDEIQDFEHDIRGAFGGSGLLKDAAFLAGRDTPLGVPKAGVSADLDALAAYVSSLTRIDPSPFRNPDGTLTDEAAEGAKIFNSAEARCASCHVPPRYTDSDLKPKAGGDGVLSKPGGFLLHDVGTLKPGSGKRLNDTLQGLDTPTLLGIWGNPSFLHDGSAKSVMEVLTTANPGDRHGKTSHLSAHQKDQLAAFLMQLDGSESTPGAVKPPAGSAYGRLAIRKSGAGIQFTWAAPGAKGDARLSILDAAGRVEAVLLPLPGRIQGAPLRFAWDARDACGPSANPGVRLLRLEWKGGSLSQRAFLFPR